MNRRLLLLLVVPVLLVTGVLYVVLSDDQAPAAKAEKVRLRVLAEAKPAAKPDSAEKRPEAEKPKATLPPESAQEPLFEVNGKFYRTLAEAIAAAEPGATIKLNGNAYLRKSAVIDKALHLDLNGFKLTAYNPDLKSGRHIASDFEAAAHALTIMGRQEVTIENGEIEISSSRGTDGNGFTGAVEVVPPAPGAPEEPAFNEDSLYDVVLRNLTVTTDVRRDAAFCQSTGKMLVDGCTVTSEGGSALYTIGKDSSAVVRDCTFTTIGESGEGGHWNNNMAVAFDGSITVESGNYVSQMGEGESGKAFGAYVFSSGGTVEIKDGSFVADEVIRTDKDMNRYGEDFGTSEVVVENGLFSGEIGKGAVGEGAEEMTGTATYGGVYDTAPTEEQVPENRQVVDYGDGTYSVEKVK